MHFEIDPSENRLVTILDYDESQKVSAAFLEHVNWPESEYTEADKQVARISPSSQVRITDVHPEVIEEILLDFDRRTPEAVAFIKETSRTPRHINKEAMDREDLGDPARDLARLLREKLNEFLETEEKEEDESEDEQVTIEEHSKSTADSLSMIDLSKVYKEPRRFLDDGGTHSEPDDVSTPN